MEQNKKITIYKSRSKKSRKTKKKSKTIEKCRIKHICIVSVGASERNNMPMYLAPSNDPPIVTHEKYMWIIMKPFIETDEINYYHIVGINGKVLAYRKCGDKGNVVLESEINPENNNAKWIIDTESHTIHPYDNHLLNVEYIPGISFGLILKKKLEYTPKTQLWDFRDQTKDLESPDHDNKVWNYTCEDLKDLFVSHQNSELLQFAKSLPQYGYIKTTYLNDKIFCSIDLSHWDKYAQMFREKIIDYYNFENSTSLYHFIKKYYPFVCDYHALNENSNLYLATRIYKDGNHISLYNQSKYLTGKKVKFNCVSLMHFLYNRGGYMKLINEPQFMIAPNKYYGLIWFTIETEFNSPMTCSNSAMPVPHISIGLIVYEPKSPNVKVQTN
jgi:hypothetical protein